MQVLHLLEKKIGSLLELIKSLKEENSKLKAENASLKEKNAHISQKNTTLELEVKSIQDAVSERGTNLNELNQEKAMTKIVVNDLIKNIDSFIKEEKQQ